MTLALFEVASAAAAARAVAVAGGALLPAPG